MKRRVEETTKVEGVTPVLHNQRSPHTATSIVQTGYPPQQGLKPSGEVPNIQQQYPVQSNNATMPSITTTSIKRDTTCGLQGGGPPHGGILVQSHIRHNKVPSSSTGSASGGVTPPSVGSGTGSGPPQFQRLKVEDALSYLDQVKYKFNSQPQVYNDFLEIMKEFKSQCIDTPGVIARVSHLFKGYPELISGFNTFLPPGYKIEVQANDAGYFLQVSVSNPLGHQTMTEIPPLTPTQPPSVVVTNQQNKPTVYGGATANLAATVPAVGGGVPIKGGNERVATVQPLVTTPPCSTVQGAAVALTGVASGAACVASGTQAAPCGVVATNNHQVAIPPALQGQQASTNQPVEFNHAINYVNKIKNRFQGQPDKYKKFLEILHTYQKEQKNVKSGSGVGGGVKHLTEAEVYSQVAQLFENHDDLLVEFGQFLPDATSHNSLSFALGAKINERKSNIVNSKYPGSGRSVTDGSGRVSTGNDVPGSNKTSPQSGNNSLNKAISRELGSNKRSAGEMYSSERGNSVARNSSEVSGPHSPGAAHTPAPPIKRQKLQSSAANNISFDSIKRVIRNSVNYENLLRCCFLFNSEVISKSELLTLAAPVFSRHPVQLIWFKHLLGLNETLSGAPSSPSSTHHSHNLHHSSSHHQPCEATQHPSVLPHTGNNITHHPTPLPLPPQIPPLLSSGMGDHVSQLSHIRSDSRPDLLTTASTADIDFSSCKRIGASYCALPKTVPPPRCSGRTVLCRQVLNDTWVSFPTWSEDSTFVTSRKTQYEEYIYRCEDERFELDLVIECNGATIRILEGIQKKMSRMPPEELAKFRLDDTLGGSSHTIHVRAIRRIYGEKFLDIMDGLKKNPSVVVPIVLRRMKAKEIEWRQAQKGFNKTWRDQNEKFYLKSLDHQGITFKQNDIKTLRSKSLYNEIEVIYDERQEGNSDKTGPHLTLSYADKSVLDDAANLLIHHVKRQTIHKQDKTRIKQLLRHFLPDMFHHPRQELSDDEKESVTDEKMDTDSSTNKENNGIAGNGVSSCGRSQQGSSKSASIVNDIIQDDNGDTKSLDDQPSLSNNESQQPSPSGDNAKMEIDAEDENCPGSPKHSSSFPDDNYTLFYGNNHWYLFIRLHQILCERLAKMSERSIKIAEEEAINSVNRKQSTAVALRLKPNEHCQDCYGVMLDMVKSVLDCSMELQTFEDTLRNMFGIHAYLGFTLDRIVSYAVRQLQYIVSEDNSVECWDLYMQYKTKSSATPPCNSPEDKTNAEAAYFRAVSTCLAGGDSCFKICIYKKECKVTLEMLDTEGDGDEDDGAGAESETGINNNNGKNVGNDGSDMMQHGEKWVEFSNSGRLNSNGNFSDKADSGVCLNDRERWSKAVYLNRNLTRRKFGEVKYDERNNKRDINGGSADKCLGASNEKNVYVAISESFLFRQGSFSKARKSHCMLSRKMYSKFSTWHLSWGRCNVSREASEACAKWLNGKSSSDFHPSMTTVEPQDPGDTGPPYRPYNRYTVQFLREVQQPPNSTLCPEHNSSSVVFIKTGIV